MALFKITPAAEIKHEMLIRYVNDEIEKHNLDPDLIQAELDAINNLINEAADAKRTATYYDIGTDDTEEGITFHMYSIIRIILVSMGGYKVITHEHDRRTKTITIEW